MTEQHGPDAARTINRRHVLGAGAGLGLAAALGGGVGRRQAANAQGAEPTPGGTLVWGMGGDADALDPHTAEAWAAWRQVTMMYESLVTKDLRVDSGTPQIVPALAERWELSSDGLSWTFFLRQGVTFHDGTPFDAEAVRINYERCSVPDSPHYYASAWHGLYAFAKIASVEVVDPATIRFTHTEPIGEFLGLLGDYYFFGIASPTQITAVGNEGLATAPSGTGPFTFVERVPGERTEFARNENYWGQKAYLDRVIVRPILEDQARVIALQTGEIDLMSDPPPDVIQSLVDEGFTLSAGDAPHCAFYWMNFRNEYGGNQKVRQAISHAIDRDTIASALFVDTAIPAYGILSPGMPAYDPAFKAHPYDPVLAKQLLTEGGYPDGFKAVWAAAPTASGWPQAGTAAEFVQRNVQEIGIELELELVEWVTYLGTQWNQRDDVLAWGTAWGMPMNFFLNIISESTYHNEETTTFNYYSTQQNPNTELDALLIAGAKETDVEAANELYRQANAKIMDDVGFLPLTHDKLPHLLRPGVQGFIHAVNMNYDLATVWIQE